MLRGSVSSPKSAEERRIPWLTKRKAAADNLGAYSAPSGERTSHLQFWPALPSRSKEGIRMLPLVGILNCNYLRFCERET